MRKITKIIIHCSASPNFRNVTVEEIDRWHKMRKFYRTNPMINPELSSIGYHYVIYTDGSVHTGRHVDEVGAHAAGSNAHSIGICLIGNDQYTSEQWDSLKRLVQQLLIDHESPGTIGHCNLPGVHKTCPGFDVFAWYADNFIEGGNVYGNRRNLGTGGPDNPTGG